MQHADMHLLQASGKFSKTLNITEIELLNEFAALRPFKKYTALKITCQSLQGHQQLRSMAFARVDANCAVVVVNTDSTGLHKQHESHRDLPGELHVLMLLQDF